VLGQGTWHLGQDRHPPSEELDALRVVIDVGMTFIDTAESRYLSAGGAVYASCSGVRLVTPLASEPSRPSITGRARGSQGTSSARTNNDRAGHEISFRTRTIGQTEWLRIGGLGEPG
jgi:hypothetical protein